MQARVELRHPSLTYGVLHFIKQAIDNQEIEQIFWQLLYEEQFTLEEEIVMLKFLEGIPENDSKRGQALSLEGGLYIFTYKEYKDTKRGYALLEAAKDLGNSVAINNLGYLHKGYGDVPMDFVKARGFFEQAVAMNNPHAMCNLGEIYEIGLDVEQDFKKAFELYKQAAMKNSRMAFYALGRMHYRGEGTAANLIEAMKLFRQAWSLSYKKSKRWIEDLLRYNPDDLYVQYHACMALNSGNLFSLLKKSPQVIGECILYDDLLTEEQKYSFLLNEKFIDCLNKVKCHALLADIYLYFAQRYETHRQEYCQEALYYLQQEESPNQEIRNRLYCYLAGQYIECGNHGEAMVFCLKSMSHIPSKHLLAHILLTDSFGFKGRHRNLLCLYLLYEESNIPTIVNRNVIVDKLLDSLGCGKFMLTEHSDQQAEILRMLDENYMAFDEALKQLEIYFYLCQLIDPENMKSNQIELDNMVNWLFTKAIFTPSHLAYWQNMFFEYHTELSQNAPLDNYEFKEIGNKNRTFLALANQFGEHQKNLDSIVHKWMLFSHRQPKNSSHQNVDSNVMYNLFRLG